MIRVRKMKDIQIILAKGYIAFEHFIRIVFYAEDNG